MRRLRPSPVVPWSSPSRTGRAGPRARPLRPTLGRVHRSNVRWDPARTRFDPALADNGRCPLPRPSRPAPDGAPAPAHPGRGPVAHGPARRDRYQHAGPGWRPGLNVASLYHYFPSKRDLLVAVLEEQGFMDTLAIDPRPPSPRTRARPGDLLTDILLSMLEVEDSSA